MKLEIARYVTISSRHLIKKSTMASALIACVILLLDISTIEVVNKRKTSGIKNHKAINPCNP